MIHRLSVLLAALWLTFAPATAQVGQIPGWPPVQPPPSGGVVFGLTYETNWPSSSNSGTTVAYGTATYTSGCTRQVAIIGAVNFTATTPAVVSISLNSVAFTAVAAATSNGGSDGAASEIWESNSAVSGTSGALSVTYTQVPGQFGANSSNVQLYCLNTNTPTASNSAVNSNLSGTVSSTFTAFAIPASGGGIVAVSTPNSSAVWTPLVNATQDFTANTGMSTIAAHTTATGTPTVTLTSTTGNPGASVIAAWSN